MKSRNRSILWIVLLMAAAQISLATYADQSEALAGLKVKRAHALDGMAGIAPVTDASGPAFAATPMSQHLIPSGIAKPISTLILEDTDSSMGVPASVTTTPPTAATRPGGPVRLDTRSTSTPAHTHMPAPTPSQSSDPAATPEPGQEPDPRPSVTETGRCVSGIETSIDSANAYLMADCQILLEMKESLAGAGALNWDESVPLERWRGVEFGGYPVRVVGLDLQKTGLTGVVPSGLGGLAGLETLDLSHNRLTGDIPRQLSALVTVEVVQFDISALSGGILAEIGRLVNVTELSPGQNQLVARIPREVGQLHRLRELHLAGNLLAGEIPASLGSLGSLEALDLGRNQLTGEIPRELGGLARLQTLDLSQNRLAGAIPPELGGLVAVQVMRLDDNGLSGSIPAELGGLTGMTRLNLGRNQLVGEIPRELGLLRRLRLLHLGGNSLAGEIPDSLGSLNELVTLDLSHNRLTGGIPSAVGGLTDIEVMRLGDNGLSGSIPAELGRLVNVTTLDMGLNQLAGEIPREIGQLVELEQLQLSDNKLAGEIPNSFGSLTNLETLDLGRNRLIGEIPRELSHLSKLRRLLLGDNSLGGTLPDELALLTKLQTFDISGNALGGCVPDGMKGIDWKIGSMQFCGDLPAVYEGGVDLSVTYIERLPRYQRYQLAYFPRGDCPYPFDEFRGATVCPEQEGIKRWPDAGDPVELIAHVWNFGDTASGPFDYAWEMDGATVRSGRHEGIEGGGHVALVLSTQWPGEDASPVVTFAVDTRDEVAELIESDNVVVDWLKGYSLGIAYTPGTYESLRLSNEPNRRLQSPEQWVQEHIALMNTLLSQAGVQDRVRAELFAIAEDEGFPEHHELRWYMDGWWVIGGPSHSHFALENYERRPDIDWGLIHELMHQLGTIDLYHMYLAAGQVLVPDANRPNQMAGCGTAYWRDEHTCFALPRIIDDIMATLQVEFIGPHTAGGLRSNTGYRRGFYGEYLYDTPTRTSLKVVDKDGDALSDVTLWLYQVETTVGVPVIDAVPEMVVTTDESGLAVLPNRGITGIVTATGHQLRPNPFGEIDVVGRNGVFLIEMEGPCTNYEWLTIVELNLAYWDGETEEAEFTKTLQCPPLETRPDIGVAPGRAVINSVSPGPPRCILRDSPHRSERLLTITGENFGMFGDSHLQFRFVDRRESSIHFGIEVEWVSPLLIRLDIGHLGELFAEEDRQRVRVRVTDFTYGPISDWSDIFVVAADANAC